MEKGLTNIAGAIMVVGLATLSVYGVLHSGRPSVGSGWGALAVLTWVFYGWRTKKD